MPSAQFVARFGLRAPPSLAPQPQGRSDPTLLQCGNLIYAGDKEFGLLRRPVSDGGRGANVFAGEPQILPRCISTAKSSLISRSASCRATRVFPSPRRSGTRSRKFLAQGGFLLVSPGCSDEKWDRSFRQEIKVCFPDNALKKIPMTHPIFSIVNPIPRLTDKHGRPVVARRARTQRAARPRLFQGGPQRRRARRWLLLLRRQ